MTCERCGDPHYGAPTCSGAAIENARRAAESCYFCKGHPKHDGQRAELESLKLQNEEMRALLGEIASRAEAVPGGEELYNFTKWLSESVRRYAGA